MREDMYPPFEVLPTLAKTLRDSDHVGTLLRCAVMLFGAFAGHLSRFVH